MGDSRGFPSGYKSYQGTLTVGVPTKTCTFTTDLGREAMVGFVAIDDDGLGGGGSIDIKINAGETFTLKPGEIVDVASFAPVTTVLLTRVAVDGYYRVLGR